MDKAIRAAYTFTKEEALAVAYATKRLRRYKRRSIFQSILACVAIVLFSLFVYTNPSDLFAWFIIALSVLLLISCWYFPKKMEANYLAGADILSARTFEADERFINLDKENGMVSVRPADIEETKTVSGVLLLFHRHGGYIELPLRVLSDEQIKNLDALLADGQKERAQQE